MLMNPVGLSNAPDFPATGAGREAVVTITADQQHVFVQQADLLNHTFA